MLNKVYTKYLIYPMQDVFYSSEKSEKKKYI